ncbi:hypothetical protein HMPREF0294_2526 [Corynebacterium glucuronolyticum ATCC 51867]|nr:hypothetical protein HMPREF0294_2526 [Corynebacterium glucuronolyticum ATCC 51867]
MSPLLETRPAESVFSVTTLYTHKFDHRQEVAGITNFLFIVFRYL